MTALDSCLIARNGLRLRAVSTLGKVLSKRPLTLSATAQAPLVGFFLGILLVGLSEDDKKIKSSLPRENFSSCHVYNVNNALLVKSWIKS